MNMKDAEIGPLFGQLLSFSYRRANIVDMIPPEDLNELDSSWTPPVVRELLWKSALVGAVRTRTSKSGKTCD